MLSIPHPYMTRDNARETDTTRGVIGLRDMAGAWRVLLEAWSARRAVFDAGVEPPVGERPLLSGGLLSPLLSNMARRFLTWLMTTVVDVVSSKGPPKLVPKRIGFVFLFLFYSVRGSNCGLFLCGQGGEGVER